VSTTPSAETLVIDYAVQVHCDLMKVGGEFNPRPNAFAFNKNNAIFREFDQVIADLKEDGTVQKLKDYWWHENVPKKECYEHRKLYNGITLMNSAGIFMVISVGIMATLVALWIENWYYDMRTKADMRKPRTENPVDAVPAPFAASTKKKPQRSSRCTII